MPKIRADNEKSIYGPEIGSMRFQALEALMTDPGWDGGDGKIPWVSLSLN